MTVEEFKARCVEHTSGHVVFRATAEEISKIRKNLSGGQWMDAMLRAQGVKFVQNAVATLFGVVIVEEEPGALAKIDREDMINQIVEYLNG